MKSKKRAVIKIENVSRIFHVGDSEVHALKDLDIEVHEGEFVSIMGPSGSGKSTAVNMVGCLDIPTRGKIFLDGKNIANLEESDLAQIRGKKIGFIFQKFNLVSTLTALENVALPMLFQGMPAEQRQKKARALLELVDLGDRINHKPTELSGGQQQRVAIARALANDPQVILADEPTGNLDSKTGIKILEFLDKLHRQGKTIIMVTHDADLAKYADRVLYLKDGAIVDNKKMKNNVKNKESIKRRLKNESK
jgi:putative ABC transport system ATP-binding protein